MHSIFPVSYTHLDVHKRQIDTLSLTIDATLNVGPNPEEMTVANGYLYVANSDGMNYGADYACLLYTSDLLLKQLLSLP